MSLKKILEMQFSMLKKGAFFIAPFIFVLFLFFGLSAGHIESIDGMGYLTVARNLVFIHKPVAAEPLWNTSMQVTKGRDGEYYAATGPLFSLLFVPSAILSKIASGETIKHFPLEFDYVFIFSSSFVNPFLGFILFVLMFKIAHQNIKEREHAFWLSFLFFVSSSLIIYTKHSFANLFSLIFLAWSYYSIQMYIKLNKQKWLWQIFLSQFFLITSYNISSLLISFLLIVNLTLQWKLDKLKFSIIFKIIFFACLGIFLGIMSYFGYNFYRFGNPFNFGYDATSFDLVGKMPLFEGIWGLLFSPGKSIFLYTPLLIGSLLLAAKNYKKPISITFFLSIGLFVLFYARYVFWHGDLSYGPRYLLPIVVVGFIVIANFYSQLKKLLFITLTILGLYVQMIGLVIPYQVHYSVLAESIFKDVKVVTREDQFNYWAVAQFIPRFSPIYAVAPYLKHELTKVLPEILFNKQIVSFIDGATLPIFTKNIDGKITTRKHILNNTLLVANKNITIKEVALSASAYNREPNILKICKGDDCINSVAQKKENNFSYLLSSPIPLENGEKFEMHFYNQEPSEEFEFDLHELKINQTLISLNEYSLSNKDRRYYKYLEESPEYYWKIRSDFHQAINLTPDFWWVKVILYKNLPPVYTYLIGVQIIMLISTGLIIFYNFCTNRKII